jgi:carbonic anhydrase
LLPLAGTREVCRAHSSELDTLANEQSRLDRLCELNVMQQVKNVSSGVFVFDAWARGQDLSVHGWVYSIGNGLIKDLDVTVSGPKWPQGQDAQDRAST